MADITFVSVPPKSLQQTIDGNATTFKLTDINDWNGTALSSASFGTYAWAVFRNSTNTRIEFMRIDPASITSATSPITIVKRGLAFDGADTEVAANKLTWTQNDTIVELGTHSPQILNYTVRTEGNQTINGVKTFGSTPVSTAGLPTASNELATKQYVDITATGTTTIDRVVAAGTAGETIAAGNLIYLKASDGRWWLCDADTAVTVENINMGIAQGAGTAGNAITDGVLTYGLDSNQTGLTANSVYYASNTAGAISLTPGTKEVTVGYSLSTTTLLFNYRFNQGLTEDQQDALTGDDGTPSGSNTFVTQTGLQKQAEIFAIDGSASSTAYTATLSPVPASLTNGMVVRVKIGLANTTTTPTLNVNGLGAKTIVKGVSTALATSDISAGQYCTFIYDSTNTVWVLQSPVSTALTPVFNGNFKSGTYTISTSTTATQTVGFRAKYILFFAINGTGGNLNGSTSNGSYDGTTNTYVGQTTNGTITGTGSCVYIGTQNNSYYITALAQNITSTSFDLVTDVTNKGTMSNTDLMWVAFN
jgi:hypothetical protein